MTTCTYRFNLNTEATVPYTMSSIEWLLIAANIITATGASIHLYMM